MSPAWVKHLQFDFNVSGTAEELGYLVIINILKKKKKRRERICHSAVLK